MLSLSKKAALVTQSDIRAMSIECDRVGGINLSQGVCNTEVPLPVLRDAQRAIEEGMNSYTRFDGLPELREAIADLYNARYRQGRRSQYSAENVAVMVLMKVNVTVMAM